MKEIAKSENIENFSQNDYIYVDKTECIYNLIKKNDRVFFSRPRRFGKSLTINTIGTLFEKGVDPYFKGTWIYDKWQQDKYPVLHLSFLKYPSNSLAEFKRQLCDDLSNTAEDWNLTKYREDSEPNVCIRNLLKALPEGKQIVLLIDEYDCQLTANINNPELYEEFRTCIRWFYADLKGVKQIKFLAVTGVTRLKDVSIFSVGSDIKDLSYKHAYSKMIGFTRDEIKHFYIDYLKLGVSYEKHIEVAEVTDADVEDLLDRMAAQYDGYCFDELHMNKVFSTYSVNSFLQELSENGLVRFGDYWYEAGGLPSILKNYLEAHNLDGEKLQTSDIVVNLNDFLNPTSLLSINENVLMCQTGYLTLKSPIDRNDDIYLGTPNREVRSSLFALLGLRVFTHNVSPYFGQRQFIVEHGSCEEIIGLFNSVLSAVSYDKYPINNESVLRALLQLYLLGKDHDVTVEQHNSKGRSDLIVNFQKRRVIIELKFSSDGKNSKSLLKEAVNQIKDKEYGTEHLGNRELLKIAGVFDASKDKRKLTVFQTVS